MSLAACTKTAFLIMGRQSHKYVKMREDVQMWMMCRCGGVHSSWLIVHGRKGGGSGSRNVQICEEKICPHTWDADWWI